MRIVYQPRHALDIANRSAAGSKAWRFEVRNATAEVSDLWLYDEISDYGVSADAFQTVLATVTSPVINLHVHSPGGNVFDGIAIYNALRSHHAHVTAKVEGLAASAASVIIQAADRRVMMKHSQMMIHNTRVIVDNLSAAEIDELKDLLLRQDRVLAGIYHERTRGGQPKLEKIMKAMAAETWFTDDEAVAFGLADEVETPKFQGQPQAMADPDEEPEPDEEPTPEPDENDDPQDNLETVDGGSDEEAMAFAMLTATLTNSLEALVR